MKRVAVQILCLLVAAAVAAVIIPAAIGKLLGDPEALRPFEEFGWPIWTAYLTAVAELAGCIALFIPQVRSLGGLLLTVVMLGAAGTNLANGHPDYVPLNLVLIAGSLLLAWQGRKYLPRRASSRTAAQS